MATINLGNEGLSDGDDIDPYLADFLGNGDTIEIPTGNYVWNGDNLDFGDDDHLVGLGNPGDVTWELEGTMAGGMDEGDNCTWENVRINGENPDPKAGVDAGSSSTMKHIFWIDGGTQSEDRFTYGGSAGGGRATFEQCLVGHMGNNCFYIDHIPCDYTDCVSVNNNIAGFRVGHDDLSDPNSERTNIRNCQVYVTDDVPTDPDNSSNGRGIRIREAGDFLIEGCEFVYEDVTGAGQPLVVSDNVSGEVNLEVRNCTWVINSGSTAIDDETGDANITGEGNTITGSDYSIGAISDTFDEVDSVIITHPENLVDFPISDTGPFNGGSGDSWSWGATSTNSPPTADVTASPATVLPGETVNFDGSASSDSDGSIVSYSWDFDDGNTGSGATTSHSYSSTGSYTVVLTVTDDDGATSDDVVTITVESSTQDPPDAEAVPLSVTNDFKAVLSYRFTALGEITRDSAEVSDVIVDNGDGTYTVKGTVKPDDTDSFQVNGLVVSWSASRPQSDYTLNYSGSNVTVDNLLSMDAETHFFDF